MNEYISLTKDDICLKLKQLAAEKKKLLIVCHRNPDGDTVSCAFALKLIYTALGGSAKCVCDSDAPKYLHFLYDSQTTINYRINDDVRHDAFCAVDVASTAQLGRLSFLADKFDFMIDHHGTGEPFAPCWVDPNASACAELICKVYRKLVLEKSIDKNADVARKLYAGIASDSGSFKYSNTTPETHIIAASLVDDILKANDGGLSSAEISRLLFDCHTRKDLAGQKLTIEKMRFAADGKIAYALFRTSELNRIGLSSSDLGGAVDIVRGIEGVLVGITIKEEKNGEEFRVSSRSSCGVNVAEICARFGGGGHAKAAGATVRAADAETAVNTIISAFEAAVNEYILNGDA